MGKSRKEKQRQQTLLLVYALLASACLLAGLILWMLPGPGSGPKPAAGTGSPPSPGPSAGTGLRPGTGTGPSASPGPGEPSIQPEAPEEKPILYLILDDGGYSLTKLNRFLRGNYPFTLAVLPGLPQTISSAQAARAAGRDVILHMPMEPRGEEDPGPGALMIDMDSREIREQVSRALSEYRGYQGINNHMGSRFTEEPRSLEPLLQVAEERELFILDSLTSSRSQLAALAEKRGLAVGQRDVFLDNTCEPGAIRRAYENALALAEEKGEVLVIGHIWCTALAEILPELYDEAGSRGIEWGLLHQRWEKDQREAGL